ADRSDGAWRRMIALPLLVRHLRETADLRRAERLRRELPGILLWALRGAARLYRQGHFTRCRLCEACVAEHRERCDPVRLFTQEQLVVRADLRLPKADAYEAYLKFCKSAGFAPKNRENSPRTCCATSVSGSAGPLRTASADMYLLASTWPRKSPS